VGEHFDAAYYRRFYERDPVHTRSQVAELASAVTGMLGWWGVPLRSVLDVGAGPGYWRDWFTQHRPAVRYRSIDVSEHACTTFGHERKDISQWRPPRPFDLVVCQGVLQYVDAPAATRAIEHLAAATRHVMYLEVPTLHDRAHVIDASATDLDCHWRSGRWYQRRLDPHFVQVGGGLWARRTGAVTLYELEAAPLRRRTD
jgi:trans-aconitate methyltransferase